MRHYRNRRIVTTAEQDARHIITTLKAIFNGELENDLTLQHYYQDVPVSMKAVINTVGDKDVEMTTHKLQAAIMAKAQDALIRTAHLPHPVLGQVRRLDSATRVARLADFSFVNVPASNREHIWVRLGKSATARFRSSVDILQGTIRNISLGGVAVYKDRYEDVPVGSVGALNLDLDGKSILIPGKLLRVTVSDQYIKYVFKLDQGSRRERELARVIARRQSEIIRRLMAEV